MITTIKTLFNTSSAIVQTIGYLLVLLAFEAAMFFINPILGIISLIILIIQLANAYSGE